MIFPVILCGGSGSRLWPLSRSAYPKQFLDLLDSGYSMLQQTQLRLAGLEDTAGSRLADTIVVCNAENRFLVAQQLQDINAGIGSILLEPCARNTAPAVACAAFQALAHDPDAVLLVLPADHVIAQHQSFTRAVEIAVEAANDGSLVTFGVKPTHAETGYGYIRKGSQGSSSACHQIESFVEKPDEKTAQQYLESGDYLWNSGMFVFSARAYLDELKKQAADIVDACEAAFRAARQDLDFLCLDAGHFESCRADSIDYAVMEGAENRAVVGLDAGWSDVGSWSSLWDIDEKDDQNNVHHGDVISINTQNSFIHSNNRLVATLGVENLVIVDTDDALLIADREQAQGVKDLVTRLKQDNRTEAENHQQVYRPWGSYQTISLGERFQVKKIIVSPGQKLSLQKHHHRAEHWIVVQGTARVTCEDNVFILNEDQSTYIPIGHKHRLENPGKIPLELIEVQSGSYLGEDDIVRYDDVYGRENE